MINLFRIKQQQNTDEFTVCTGFRNLTQKGVEKYIKVHYNNTMYKMVPQWIIAYYLNEPICFEKQRSVHYIEIDITE